MAWRVFNCENFIQYFLFVWISESAPPFQYAGNSTTAAFNDGSLIFEEKYNIFFSFSRLLLSRMYEVYYSALVVFFFFNIRKFHVLNFNLCHCMSDLFLSSLSVDEFEFCDTCSSIFTKFSCEVVLWVRFSLLLSFTVTVMTPLAFKLRSVGFSWLTKTLFFFESWLFVDLQGLREKFGSSQSLKLLSFQFFSSSCLTCFFHLSNFCCGIVLEPYVTFAKPSSEFLLLAASFGQIFIRKVSFQFQ